jgi:uncharacterized membrane protein
MTALLASWGSLYANHATVRTIIAFLHVGPIVTGGGAAIVEDRALLLAFRGDTGARRARLGGLGAVHRVVIASLMVLVISGLLMMATDLDTFLQSRVFWIKMGLVALLLANGGLIRRAERRATIDTDAQWRTLRVTAVASMTLWLLTTFAGIALQNIG